MSWYAIKISQKEFVMIHWWVVIQPNGLSVDDNICSLPSGVKHSHEELPVATHIIQSSSNKLSTPVAVKCICIQRKIIHIP